MILKNIIVTLNKNSSCKLILLSRFLFTNFYNMTHSRHIPSSKITMKLKLLIKLRRDYNERKILSKLWYAYGNE